MNPETGERCCGNCECWQDYEQRVYARIAKVRGDIGLQLIELRLCQFEPHPGADVVRSEVYTDNKYCCDEFRFAEGMDK